MSVTQFRPDTANLGHSFKIIHSGTIMTENYFEVLARSEEWGWRVLENP
jgi:hypothetical protein